MLTNNTYVNPVEGPEGYAVFATKKIKAGDPVEEFVFRQCPWRTKDLDPRVGFLHQVSFMRSCACGMCRQHGVPFLLMGGNATIYTHSTTPNAEVRLPEEDQIPTNNMLIGALVAATDIQKDEEISINYALQYSEKKVDAATVAQQQRQTLEAMEAQREAVEV